MKQKIAHRHDLQTCIKILQDALKTPPLSLGGPPGNDSDKHPPHAAQDAKHNRMRVSTYAYKPPARGGAPTPLQAQSGAGGSVPQMSMPVGMPLPPPGSVMHPATTTVQHTQTFIHSQHAHQPLRYPPALQKFKECVSFPMLYLVIFFLFIHCLQRMPHLPQERVTYLLHYKVPATHFSLVLASIEPCLPL